jgi:hypothetical protein
MSGGELLSVCDGNLTPQLCSPPSLTDCVLGYGGALQICSHSPPFNFSGCLLSDRRRLFRTLQKCTLVVFHENVYNSRGRGGGGGAFTYNHPNTCNRPSVLNARTTRPRPRPRPGTRARAKGTESSPSPHPDLPSLAPPTPPLRHSTGFKPKHAASQPPMRWVESSYAHPSARANVRASHKHGEILLCVCHWQCTC